MDSDFDTTISFGELQWRGHVQGLDQLQDTTDSQSIETLHLPNCTCIREEQAHLQEDSAINTSLIDCAVTDYSAKYLSYHWSRSVVRENGHFNKISVANYIPMGILLIELEDEELKWHNFEAFASLIARDVVLCEYAFSEYRLITNFVHDWSQYIKAGSKGFPIVPKSTLTRFRNIYYGIAP